MKKGRKPKPTAKKRLEGNPGKRPLNENEPEFSVGTTCPAWLSPQAKSEWRRMYPELSGSRVLTKGDRAIFAAYCQEFANWQRLVKETEAFVKEHGTTVYRTKSGVARTIPQVADARAAAAEMRRNAVELGLTPSSRSRVSGDGAGKEADPLLEFLNAGPPTKNSGAEDKPN